MSRRLVWYLGDDPLPDDGRFVEADTANVAFVPVSREMIPHLRDWSEPVRVRLDEHGDGTFTLLAQKVE